MKKTGKSPDNFFRENLIRLRTAAGWSQSVLASRIVEADLLPTLSDGAIKMWETGERNPSAKSRRAVARIFGVSESLLLADPSETKPGPTTPTDPNRPKTRAELLADIVTNLPALDDNELGAIWSGIETRLSARAARTSG